MRAVSTAQWRWHCAEAASRDAEAPSTAHRGAQGRSIAASESQNMVMSAMVPNTPCV